MKHVAEFEADEGTGGSFLAHLPAILWHRRRWMIAPLVLLSLAGVAAAFLLPVRYSSTATLLVQSSALPTAVAGDDATELIDRRIARIREQVLSRPELIELVNRYQLYPSERSEGALSEIVEKMRKAVEITPLSAALQQRPNGSATIAFTLSYTYSDPQKAQAVAQDLVEQVLQLDATGNTQQAGATVQFLTDQSRGLEKQIAALEAQIAGIKGANGSVLSNAGMTMVGGSSGSYEVQIAGLQRENAQLLSQRNLAADSATRDPVVSAAESQLAAAQAIYSDDHPDVRAARQRLAEAKALAARNVAKIPLQAVDAQIAFNNAQIAQLRSAAMSDSARLNATVGAQARAPALLEEINQLQGRLASLNGQYQGVSDRLMQAKAGVKAENEQLGERLSVVDPPVIPDQPTFPNRLLFSAGGVAAGLAAGLALMLLVELFKRPIRDPATLTSLFGQAPLGVIPTIGAKPARRRRGWRFWRRAR